VSCFELCSALPSRLPVPWTDLKTLPHSRDPEIQTNLAVRTSIEEGPLLMNTVLRVAPALLAALLSSAQPTSTSSNAISLAGSGYSVPSSALAVAPGQVIVLQVYGVTTAINSPTVPVAGPNGYPLTLAGISVDLIQGTPPLSPTSRSAASIRPIASRRAARSQVSLSRSPSSLNRTRPPRATRPRSFVSAKTALPPEESP
jgi:hypothetical protein